MSPFPTLDSLRPLIPKAEAATDWVAMLSAASVPPRAAANGWMPPTVEVTTTPPVDLEALRASAYEEAFGAGYREGRRAGIERGLAEGRRTGRDEGHEAARQEVLQTEAAGLAEFQTALAAVVGGVGPAVERWKAEVEASAEARATALAMDAVRALLASELATERPDAMGIVREALGFAEGAIRATVRLAPFDRAALAERKEEILQACAGLRDVDLVDDRSIEYGCVVETEGGVVDATLATRLGLLEAA